MSDKKKIKNRLTDFSKNAGFSSDKKTDTFFEFSDVQNLGRKLTRPFQF